MGLKDTINKGASNQTSTHSDQAQTNPNSNALTGDNQNQFNQPFRPNWAPAVLPSGMGVGQNGLVVNMPTTFTGNATFTGTLAVTGLTTLLGNLALNGTTVEIDLNGSVSNEIVWNVNGVAPPSFTTRSVGTKLVLSPNIGASSADYAIGIDTGTLWNSVSTNASFFKWYAGTSLVMLFDGVGNLAAGSAADNPNQRSISLNLGTRGTLNYEARTDTGGGYQWQFTDAAHTIYFSFTYTGGVANKVSAGTAWVSISDKRTKENIRPFTQGLNELRQIQPVNFDYNGKGGSLKGPSRNASVIAQDIQAILPQTVIRQTQGADGEHLHFDGSDLIYVCINAIKELDARLASVEKKLGIATG
jgi:hypothetical protein